jgi:hypothetical protein
MWTTAGAAPFAPASQLDWAHAPVLDRTATCATAAAIAVFWNFFIVSPDDQVVFL